MTSLRLSTATLVWLILSCTMPIFAQLQEPSPPVNLIIDSDMAIDADDVGDHAVMWGLADRGEVRVLALICSSANDYSAPAMRTIANYYGHQDVPVGAHKGSTPNINGASSSAYTQQITNQFGTPGDIRFNYPDAVTVYRQALANAPDNSVYIVSNGYYEPMRDLLQSHPDAISPLTGMQLVAQKVRRLVPSGGWFPSGSDGNFTNDPDAASYVFANWPGEIVSVGANVGWDVITGPSANSDPNVDPVKAAYNLYQQAQGLSSATTPAWGQVALLFAVRGGIGTNFTIGGYNGQTVVADSTQSQPGFDSWQQTPSVGQSWMQKAISTDSMAAIINPLLQSSSNMPILRSVSPNSLPAGSSGQAIALTGTNFFNDSQVLLNGNSRPTTFVGSTQLSVQLSTSDLAQPGNPALSVLNSSEGGWYSNARNLSITGNPAPSLSGISPTNVMAGSSAFTLNLVGNNFVSGSTVQVNGVNRTTSFVSATQLTASISASDVAFAGYLSIAVVNPAPGGGTSAALTLTVNNPVPSISSISPNPAVAAAGGFTLSVTGTGFVTGSVVQVDGVARPTTFVNATQLQAQVSGTGTSAGQHSVTVFNAAPGGGPSNSVSLMVVSLLGELMNPGTEFPVSSLAALPESFFSLAA